MVHVRGEPGNEAANILANEGAWKPMIEWLNWLKYIIILLVTVNQLIEIYHNIISNMDRGRDVRFVFCDVSKAFDKIWHKGLLFKLKLTGVSKQLISWIESYLSDRQQKVVSEGFSSTLKGIKAGVPQGSVLVPFLFLVYINDIVNDINNDIQLFADDTSLFVVVENDHAAATTSLTDDLNVISNWAKKWAIQFNSQKTKNIVFSRRDREHPPVILD